MPSFRLRRRVNVTAHGLSAPPWLGCAVLALAVHGAAPAQPQAPAAAVTPSGADLGTAVPPPSRARIQTWQWRDANGRLHVSDRPPPRGTPGVQARDRAVPQAPTPVARELPASAADDRSQTLPAPQPGRRAAAASAPDAERQQQIAALRAQACQQSQLQWVQLQAGQLPARDPGTGRVVPMDAAMQATEAQRLRSAMEINCR